jgi:hypothetical protein
MIVGNQEMMQLRFGQCGVPVMCGILGPIGVDGPLAGLWRQAAARPQSKQPRTGHNSALLRRSIVRLSLIVCSPVRRLNIACTGAISKPTAMAAHAVIGCVKETSHD